jgi:cobalt-zinc-cadmium resistance protein CzcA
MFEKIIRISLANKLVVLIGTAALVIFGIAALRNIALDAVPDITNNQVQVVTTSPSLAAQEIEQFITYPVEIALANIPGVEEIRSISRYGLSVVTVVFDDDIPTLEARQYVKERLDAVRGDIPDALGSPELMPITTGLGEIYQYVLKVDPAFRDRYDAMELRTIQDWIVKRQLAGTPGIVEVSSFGGYLKQYELAVDPLLMSGRDVTLNEVMEAMRLNNANTGGAYIEKGPRALYIRTEGLIGSLEEMEQIAVSTRNGVPVLMKDIGLVGFGAAPRFGAMTMDGEGEAVGGITLMLKGENSYKVTNAVKKRMAEIEKSLPEGISIYAYLERTSLIDRTIATVRNNLLEGGAIVIIVLVFLLGNFRAGLIVASIIPLSMLFALIMMRVFGVSANLMSLGAIDFGIVVDGAVIIVEHLVQVLTIAFVGKTLTQKQMDEQVARTAASIYKSAAFGVLIIMVVFIPVLSLSGIEGKMFRPMAQTLTFALAGALLLSLTWVPVISSLFMSKKIKPESGMGHRIIKRAEGIYERVLKKAFAHDIKVVVAGISLFLLALWGFTRLGAEFIPDLEEGDLAVQVAVQPGSSLSESIVTATKVERILKSKFPEVKHVVSKIGTAEVPTDPMAMEDMDIMVILKPKKEWTSAKTREALVGLMKEELEVILGIFNEFSQPIQLRFNELMTGAKTDIAVKIYGESQEVLFKKGNEAARLIGRIPGAGDVKVEQVDGLPQLMLRYDRPMLARYGLTVQEVNDLVRSAFAGTVAGLVYEGQRRFDLVVRLNTEARQDPDLKTLLIRTKDNQMIPLAELVEARYEEGPMQISRENTQRRINVGVNVRERDVASLVADIKQALDQNLNLPPGYTIKYGGTFENLEKAKERLLVAVPIALALIFLLLYFAFGQIKYVLMIGASVPFSAIGGVAALHLRGMPFSISAGIGFIALFGVAVLNGIVMIAAINQLRDESGMAVREAVFQGAISRLRPVLMTGLVAALGFVPMALSTTAGAEVQKPLATVVIGGIVSDTILTLLILPILYLRFPKRSEVLQASTAMVLLGLMAFGPASALAQPQQPITLERAIEMAQETHPMARQARLRELQAAEERKKAILIEPLDAMYQYGQFNTREFDYYIEGIQDLGNIPGHFKRGAYGRQLEALRAQERQLSERELEYLVRAVWQEWLARTKILKVVKQEAARLRNFNDKIRLMAAVGEISLLDEKVFQAKLAQYDNLVVREQFAHTRVSNQLRTIIGFDGSLDTPDTLSVFPMPIANTQLNPLLTEVANQQVQLERKALQVAQTALFPNLTIGYFNQEIERVPNFQGYMVGLRIPLWNRPQLAAIRQARLEVSIAENQYQFLQIQREQERQTAMEAVLANFAQWERYGKLAAEQSEALFQAGWLAYESGETDFFRFFETIRTAIDLQIESIDLLNQYNQSVLQYQFLTK